MKDESCRKCGNALEVNKKCDICYIPNQMHCHECEYVSDEQIHFQCMMISKKRVLLAN